MSGSGWSVRRAVPADVTGISQLIVTTLFRSNAEDYPQKVLERIAEVNAPSEILASLERRDVFVAVDSDDRIVGTASVDGAWLKSFFVHPDLQGQGIGQHLLATGFDSVAANGEDIAWLQSSLTAVDFYSAAGFKPIREIIDGEDRTIVMQAAVPRR